MIEIKPYENRFQPDFKRLNLEWLDHYKLTESHDLEILDNPEGTVLSRGGHIFVALDGKKIVGTAGLWKENETTYELVKMAVDPAYRGRGISRHLLEKCLAVAREKGAKKVFLFSNSQLTAALGLYEKYGFSYVPATGAPFLTADVKMELIL